jgi:hypothetical protein
MRKPDLNFTIDLMIFAFFLLLASTGLLIYFILPAGHGYLTVWGMNRHDWGDIHFWVALIFLGLVFTHIGLHWNWIKTMISGVRKRNPSSRAKLFGIIGFIFIILILVTAPFLSTVEDTRTINGQHEHPSEIQH